MSSVVNFFSAALFALSASAASAAIVQLGYDFSSYTKLSGVMPRSVSGSILIEFDDANNLSANGRQFYTRSVLSYDIFADGKKVETKFVNTSPYVTVVGGSEFVIPIRFGLVDPFKVFGASPGFGPDTSSTDLLTVAIIDELYDDSDAGTTYGRTVFGNGPGVNGYVLGDVQKSARLVTWTIDGVDQLPDPNPQPSPGPNPVPLPGSAVLLGAGLFGLAQLRRCSK